ncbi:hypothetical protein U3516DRAFT_764154 [Neocallimastix sp. 'constans']
MMENMNLLMNMNIPNGLNYARKVYINVIINNDEDPDPEIVKSDNDIIYQMILDDVKPNPFPDDEDEKYTGIVMQADAVWCVSHNQTDTILWLVLLYDKDDDGTIIEAYYVIIFGVADGHTDPKRLVAQTRDGRDVWYTIKMEQVDTNRKKYGAQLYESTTDSYILRGTNYFDMNYSTTVYQSNLFIVSSKFIIGLPGHTTFNPNVENYKNKNIVKQLPKIESLNSIDKTNFNEDEETKKDHPITCDYYSLNKQVGTEMVMAAIDKQGISERRKNQIRRMSDLKTT